MLVEMLPRATNGAEPPPQVAQLMTKVDVVLCPTSKSLTHTEARRAATAAGARVGHAARRHRSDHGAVHERGLSTDCRRTHRFAPLMAETQVIRVESPAGTSCPRSFAAWRSAYPIVRSGSSVTTRMLSPAFAPRQSRMAMIEADGGSWYRDARPRSSTLAASLWPAPGVAAPSVPEFTLGRSSRGSSSASSSAPRTPIWAWGRAHRVDVESHRGAHGGAVPALPRTRTILEANISQTIGSAERRSPAGRSSRSPPCSCGGMAPPFWQVVVLAYLGAVLGIAAMVPLRRLLIVRAATSCPTPKARPARKCCARRGGRPRRVDLQGMAVGAAVKLASPPPCSARQRSRATAGAAESGTGAGDRAGAARRRLHPRLPAVGRHGRRQQSSRRSC